MVVCVWCGVVCGWWMARTPAQPASSFWAASLPPSNKPRPPTRVARIGAPVRRSSVMPFRSARRRPPHLVDWLGPGGCQLHLPYRLSPTLDDLRWCTPHAAITSLTPRGRLPGAAGEWHATRTIRREWLTPSGRLKQFPAHCCRNHNATLRRSWLSPRNAYIWRDSFCYRTDS